MVLDICPNSYSSRLPSSWMMRLDSSLNFIKFSGFVRSSPIDFVCEPDLNFQLLLVLSPFALHPSRLHWVLLEYGHAQLCVGCGVTARIDALCLMNCTSDCYQENGKTEMMHKKIPVMVTLGATNVLHTTFTLIIMLRRELNT